MREASCFLLVVFVAAQCSVLSAGKFNKKLSAGDSAPAWSDLPGIDGKTHSLKDYEAQAIVLIVTCNHCPVSTKYQSRFNKLVADYRDRGVAVVAINANHGKAETLEKMTQRAAKEKFAFDYLRDGSQASARAYGASTTPTVFLLDADRKVAYLGAFDDNWQAEAAVEHHYLRDALDALLAGDKIEIPETRSAGCVISYQGEDD